jgi:hypothetical protein
MRTCFDIICTHTVCLHVRTALSKYECYHFKQCYCTITITILLLLYTNQHYSILLLILLLSVPYTAYIRYPELPLLRVGSAHAKNYLPIEVCHVAPNQRVMKPTDAQTSNLIRVACRRPDVRRGLVHEQLETMESDMRAHSERFGVDVGLKQIRMAGRVLDSPAVRYY